MKEKIIKGGEWVKIKTPALQKKLASFVGFVIRAYDLSCSRPIFKVLVFTEEGQALEIEEYRKTALAPIEPPSFVSSRETKKNIADALKQTKPEGGLQKGAWIEFKDRDGDMRTGIISQCTSYRGKVLHYQIFPVNEFEISGTQSAGSDEVSPIDTPEFAIGFEYCTRIPLIEYEPALINRETGRMIPFNTKATHLESVIKELESVRAELARYEKRSSTLTNL